MGETFTLNATINTGSNSISGAELHIQYDAQKLQAISIDNASAAFLPLVLVDGSASGGFAFITLGSQPSQPKKGAGTLATLIFKALASTGGAETLVKFTSDTRIAGTGEIGNVLASQPAPAAITINTPAPTGTPTPTVPGGATPTPTSAGGGGNTTPTPTRTGNVGIGRTAPTATPIAVATVPPVQKGGPVQSQPTTPPIPVTAELTPTIVLTIGGVILFIAGVASLLVL